MTEKPKRDKLPALARAKRTTACAMTGSNSKDFSAVLTNQAVYAISLRSDSDAAIDQKINAVFACMQAINPRDEIEGMLAAQMVAAHNASMECYKRAMIPEQTIESRDYNLTQANKLCRTYTMQIDALQRYRGKGQQKMTVEHVHIHAGGQAIVGNVTHPKGGGTQKKTEEQPHAKVITYAPEQAMPSKNKKQKAVPITRDV
jgi:hypothetical protein